jgi:hypothetical protein
MPRALPLVATLLAIGSVWSAEPAPEPVRPLDWKPIVPVSTAPATSPAPAAPATPAPAPAYTAPAAVEAKPAVPLAVADASRFIPFNGVIIEPRVISTVNGETVAGVGWNLDFSLIHNRVTALVRGLPESDAYRTVVKDQLDFDLQVEGFGQIAADPDLNPANHQSGKLLASAGYGLVGAAGSANAFSDDASSLYFDAAVAVGLETNQSLSSSQMVTGIRLITTPSLKADLADFNIFDWIPRVGRFLSGDDWSDNGSGRAMPIITLGLDNVSAGSNDLRDQVAPDDSSYMRIHVAITGRAPIWHLPFSDQYLYGTASVEAFQELSPPSAVDDSGLDFIDNVSLGLEMPNNLTISVHRGELPMDPGRRTYWTLGWKLTL